MKLATDAAWKIVMPGSSASPVRNLTLLWLVGAAALLIAVVLALSAPAALAQASASVSIQHHMYMPANLTVPVGATVTWTNEDGAIHTVTSDAKGQFSSGWKTKGARYSFTFARPGTYPYHCSLHKDMHGTVTVTGG
jgi:plastocyanin